MAKRKFGAEIVEKNVTITGTRYACKLCGSDFPKPGSVVQHANFYHGE